jgi:hypothetical protein
VPYGALTQLWAGTSREGADLDGKVFLFNRVVVIHVSCFDPVSHTMGEDWARSTRLARSQDRERPLGVVGGASQGNLRLVEVHVVSRVPITSLRTIILIQDVASLRFGGLIYSIGKECKAKHRPRHNMGIFSKM